MRERVCAEPEAWESGEFPELLPCQENTPGRAGQIRPLGDLLECRFSRRRVELAQGQPDLVEGAQTCPGSCLPGQSAHGRARLIDGNRWDRPLIAVTARELQHCGKPPRGLEQQRRELV